MRSHTGERKYQCNHCPQKFITKGHLKDHEKRHFKIKPFKCEECGTAFYRSTQLKKHHLNKGLCEMKKQTRELQEDLQFQILSASNKPQQPVPNPEFLPPTFSTPSVH